MLLHYKNEKGGRNFVKIEGLYEYMTNSSNFTAFHL